MARLFVDRMAINTEASKQLVFALQSVCGKLTVGEMHLLILEAGFLPDYKDNGVDMASIRLAIRQVPNPQQEELISWYMIKDNAKRAKKK